MTKTKSLRGYMGARMLGGRSVPQHIQQLVMRDYCKARGYHYLLAGVEYRMEGSTLMLDALLKELDGVGGIVMYSLYLMPRGAAKRARIYRRLFKKRASLHLAAESFEVKRAEDAIQLEETLLLLSALEAQKPEELSLLSRFAAHAAA